METPQWTGLPPLDVEWRAETTHRQIQRLTAECERLRARVAALEDQVANPAAADRDLRMLLKGIERLRVRLAAARVATDGRRKRR